MERKEFLQALQGGQVTGAYLFEGVEENIKAATLAALRRAYVPEGLEELNETLLEAPDTDALIAACETLPFAAEKRLVIVREHPALSGRSEADEGLIAYIERVPDFCVLVFMARGKADGRKKLYAAIKKRGGIVSFNPLSDQELTDWIIRAFEKNGKSVTARVASLLAFTVGSDTALMRTEIEKLTSLTGERRDITENDIRAIATRSIECTVFEMVDAVVAGQKGRALGLMRDMLTQGQERLGILAMLLRQYRLLQHVKIMQYEKVPRGDFAQRLGVASFAADRYVRQAAGCTNAEVKKAVDICLQTEYGVKSGQLNEEGALETAVIALLGLKNR